MKSITARKGLLAATFGVVVAFVACAAPGITDVTSLGQASRTLGGTIGDIEPNLIECPASEEFSSTTVVTPLGGALTLGGSTISIPAGAVLLPTTITVTIPASKYMEIDVSAGGVPHFVFEVPVTVTLSYARCTRANIDKTPLSVWYIDSETKAPLELMGGIDDKLARTVTFTTGHLSGYAVAN